MTFCRPIQISIFFRSPMAACDFASDRNNCEVLRDCKTDINHEAAY